MIITHIICYFMNSLYAEQLSDLVGSLFVCLFWGGGVVLQEIVFIRTYCRIVMHGWKIMCIAVLIVVVDIMCDDILKDVLARCILKDLLVYI